MSQDPDTLIAAMEQLMTLLVDEDRALRSFDLEGIAAATEAKSTLEQTISSALENAASSPTWPAPQRERLLALRERALVQARANQRRLVASLGAVRNLVDHITGAPRSSYGPGRGPGGDVRPVLASEVG